MESKLTFGGLTKILEEVNGKFLQVSGLDCNNCINPIRSLCSYVCREKENRVLILEDNGVEEEYGNRFRWLENNISDIEIIDKNEYNNELLAISILITFVTGTMLQIVFN